MKVGSSRSGSKTPSEDFEQLKSECTRRIKRKRLHSLRSDESADSLLHTTKERKRSKERAGVPNKDLLKVFQNSYPEEDAKELLSDIVERDTTNCEQALLLKDHLFDAFKHA